MRPWKLVLLLALPGLTAAVPAAIAPCYAQEGVSSPLAGVSLPKKAVRQSDSGLESGLGRLMDDAAKDFHLPPREGESGDAEVYFWAGDAYQSDRVPFLRTMLQKALTGAGYTYTPVDSTVDNVPNAFDTEAYGTGALELAPFDSRPFFFHATNAAAHKTLVGVWLDQGSQNRLVLALGAAGDAPGHAETQVPGVRGSDVWLVKDIKNATKGMPALPLPAFPKLAAKPGLLRGVVEDEHGRPIAGAHIIAWSSAAGGFRTSLEGRTNTKGVYQIPLSTGICQVVNADCRVSYNGTRLLLPLDPADGERDQFPSSSGHIENFVLRTSGPSDENGHSYGAPVRVLTDTLPSGGVVEMTFKPSGPLLDGSAGKTLVFRFKPSSIGETFLGDLLIGHYTLTAQVYDGEDALPLQVKKTFHDDGEDNPLGPSLDVNFTVEDNELANLGRTNIRRFEVTLQP